MIGEENASVAITFRSMVAWSSHKMTGLQDSWWTSWCLCINLVPRAISAFKMAGPPFWKWRWPWGRGCLVASALHHKLQHCTMGRSLGHGWQSKRTCVLKQHHKRSEFLRIYLQRRIITVKTSAYSHGEYYSMTHSLFSASFSLYFWVIAGYRIVL